MNGALWLLPLFAVGYALWAFFRLRRMERNEPADGIVSEDTPCRQEIIGRSRFVLDLRHSRPQAAVESETEKVTLNLWKRRIKRDKCLRNACQ